MASVLPHVADREDRWGPTPQPAPAHAPYLAALERYAARDAVRFHVPGHKGGAAAPPLLQGALGPALAFDVPSCIEGIDLGPGETPLEEAQRLAAETWGARRTWFLVNGATEASHALCLALGLAEGTVVVQRNVHASTMHGLILAGLKPAFVAPHVDPRLHIAHCVTPADVAATLDRTPRATAVFVVSPTYFGATADIAGLAAVCRERDVALIVDEAWGSHFHFHDALPTDALAAGADAVISGTHKLVGSLTQSAMLHLGARHCPQLHEEDIARGLALVRTTSPNSLLLASLDAARAYAAGDGERELDGTLRRAAALKAEIAAIDGLSVLGDELVGQFGVAGFDPLRVVVDVTGTGLDGHAVAAAVLEMADVNLELLTHTVVIAHLGMADRIERSGPRLVDALRRVATELRVPVEDHILLAPPQFADPCMAPREAFFATHKRLALQDAVGAISADTVAVYPPGIANVLPGERLTEDVVGYLLEMAACGYPLRATYDAAGATIRVVC